MVELLRHRLTRLAAMRAGAREVIDAAAGAGVHALFVVEEDYRVAMLDAEAGFVELLIQKIINPKDGWSPQWAAFHAQRSERQP